MPLDSCVTLQSERHFRPLSPKLGQRGCFSSRSTCDSPEDRQTSIVTAAAFENLPILENALATSHKCKPKKFDL